MHTHGAAFTMIIKGGWDKIYICMIMNVFNCEPNIYLLSATRNVQLGWMGIVHMITTIHITQTYQKFHISIMAMILNSLLLNLYLPFQFGTGAIINFSSLIRTSCIGVCIIRNIPFMVYWCPNESDVYMIISLLAVNIY